MKSEIIVIDYDCGNLGCVYNALDHLGFTVSIQTIDRVLHLDASNHMILLPGVGNYTFAIEKIKRIVPLSDFKKWLLSSKKLMCICLGFQLLYHSSLELSKSDNAHNNLKESTDGLSVFSSSVEPFGSNENPSLNIGWRRSISHASNEIVSDKIHNLIVSHCFYHMHSFGIPLHNHSSFDHKKYDWFVTSNHTQSGVEFINSFKYNNILGLQFHPEKSGEYGLELIKLFYA